MIRSPCEVTFHRNPSIGPSLYFIQGSGSANWFKSGNWLRCVTLLLWSRIDFSSLHLKLFCAYRSSKYLAYLKWQISSDTLISQSLWIPSSTVNQGKSSFSTSFTMGQLFGPCFSQATKDIVRAPSPHPKLQVATLNPDYLLSRPMSSWSNLMFLPPSFHSLHIHSHTCSLDFCLYKLEKSCISRGCIALPYGSHSVPHLLGPIGTWV